jgi:hypothetical protein
MDLQVVAVKMVMLVSQVLVEKRANLVLEATLARMADMAMMVRMAKMASMASLDLGVSQVTKARRVLKGILVHLVTVDLPVFQT